MSRLSAISLCTMLSAVLLAAGCGNDSGPTATIDPTDTPKKDTTTVDTSTFVTALSGGYSKKGQDSLVFSMPASTVCKGDSAKVTGAYQQTVYVRIAGDTLKASLAAALPLMRGIMSTPAFDTGTAAILNMMATVAAFPNSGVFVNFVRVGSGTGVVGKWAFAGIDYGMLGLAMDAKVRAQADSIVAGIKGSGSSAPMLVEFTDTDVRGLVSRRMLGESLMGSLVDTSKYAVTTTTNADGSLKLTGAKTGEVITVSVDNQGNTIFRNQAGTTHTFYLQPKSCPNPPAPVWFAAFLVANAK